MGAVTTGVTSWAIISHSAASFDSKAPSSVNPAPQDDADTLLQAGILQQKYHDLDGADRTYRRVLELDPQNKFAWYNLGVIAHGYGRVADARADYDKALKIDPVFPSALFNEALLLEPREPDRAAGLLKRVIARDPQAATAHLHLGRIWQHEKHAAKAADEFRRAVAADPSLRPQVPEEFR
ncbi:tetratricopeptide repeat protein [Streptomyces tropicalis]|uniref:Tetratricopeptide repeat protein n=1 Tax=Streptomyces tropicalis TaxID=3034234 RepID=A0ABT6A1B0_9ACTN|nr:tetratricopeptide repeat protein [Streptomyces tropicalis]MDF3298161.1 tetratricopeptide repeat protein [Streptomyces tropicalis]